MIEQIIDGDRYTIEEDVDNHDYVFRTRDLSECRGARFEAKRKRINRFRRTSGRDAHVEQLDLTDEATGQAVNTVFSAWEHSRELEREEVSGEHEAIQLLLRNAGNLDLFSIGVVIGGRLRAFSICEVIGTHAIAHFEKAEVSYDGLFQFLKQQVGTRLLELGCELVNYEQDLGLPGIRREKRSWRPATFLKKFVVSEAV